MLQTVRTVIVDEIHAVADDKRGSHLALSLERLEHLVVNGVGGDVYRSDGVRTLIAPEGVPTLPAGRPPVRIGLSATVRPIEDVARFLVGANGGGCEIVDEGHVRDMELRLEVPLSPVEAIASGEVWEEVYDRIAELIGENRTTLVFVNTRRLAERVTHHLSQRIGEENVTSHHGSLSKERRLDAEERLKAGRLKALVATASLELGIDIGTVDLVVQIGSPHTIASLLQRVGRSGRLRGAVAKGRLFAMSRDELVECAALLLAARENRLDRLIIPERPLDILAQQIVAAAACRDWPLDDLYALVRGAWPYRDLAPEDFRAVVHMLADGYATRRGRRAAYVHFDAVNDVVRGRRGARLAAVTSGGAIPDVSDYQVVLDPEGTVIGSINEDFAIESMTGDIFQLGNASWEILKIETGRVRVADARGKPPSIPFWLGEAPARTPELSELVSRVRSQVAARLAQGRGVAARWLVESVGVPPEAASQIEAYLGATREVLGVVPTQETLVLERFFDEAGGMQLVLHAPFGGRINRAWGLALRKKFCRSFNFELQAAANEDAIVLSLGPQHSFPLDDVFGYLKPETARETLIQALLPAPMFQTRWRWNAGRSLAILRMRGGRKTPAQLLRMQAEDLLAAAFPQAAACFEHIHGDIEVPWEHPVVRQTVEDCLTEAMDIEALEAILGRIRAGELELVARDVPEPSPMAHEILNARPYAFLDDAPAEERRTLAVSTRRNLEYSADDFAALDPEAIARVRAEAWPDPRDRDEVHDALDWLGIVTAREGLPWAEWLDALEGERRATLATPGGLAFWVAAERLPEARAVWPHLELRAPIEAPARNAAVDWDPRDALASLLRGRLEGLGPVTVPALAAELGLDSRQAEAALIALESEGTVLRGRFTPGIADTEWCHRRLLARIHRYTIDRLRAEIEPASPADFMRFLFRWQRLDPATRLAGARGVREVVEQLQAFDAPASAWESDILPARIEEYDPEWLDALSLSGAVAWGRLVPPPAPGVDRPRSGPVRSSPLALFVRADLPSWLALAADPDLDSAPLSHYARETLRALRESGPAFHQDLVARTGLLPAQVERGLAELASWGVVTADGMAGLRALIVPESERRARRPRAGRGRQLRFTDDTLAGRWALLREGAFRLGDRELSVERWARQLLTRYGVVVRRLLEREPPLAPWRDVARVLRRLEMRGEVRGGRFLLGASGEQFALPQAVEALRATRRRETEGSLLAVGAGDPLNLTGIVTPGERIPSIPTNVVLYRDGVPVAARIGRERRLLRDEASRDERRRIETALVGPAGSREARA
jgi:ATP-dependent Lhr-like helicase